MKKNAVEFQKVLSGKAEEMVILLDLFQGQLSLTDILNQDIPLLNALKDAKSKINGEINKEREKQIQKINKQQQQNQK